MPQLIAIDANGKIVDIRLMDESWIINQCAGAHPFKPTSGVVWSEAQRCARLPEIPGSRLQDFLRETKNNYGNCAAIARHEDRVLGHLVWIPRSTAREIHATGWHLFGPAEEDEGTLVVVNLAFCSLSGHEFRRKGIGSAMVGLMIAWAREEGWRAIEVYETTGGLFPWDWFDVCVPPRPFWEGRGFVAFACRPQRYTEEELSGLLADNPRGSAAEQGDKQRIIAAIRAGQVDESRIGSFDLRLTL
jgi:GNAT superfamily N-acetyltransferase